MAQVKCPGCGAENGPADVFCYKCEARLAPGEEGWTPESPVPRICGILLLAVGTSGLFTWLLVLLLLTHVYSELVFIDPGLYLVWYIAFKFVLSAIAIVGGVASLRGRHRAAQAGAIAGFLTFGPLFLFSIACLLVLRLLARFRSAFRPSGGDRGQIL